MIAHLALVLTSAEVETVQRGEPVRRPAMPVRAAGEVIGLAGPDRALFAEARVRCEAIPGGYLWHLEIVGPLTGRALPSRGQLAPIDAPVSRPAPMW